MKCFCGCGRKVPRGARAVSKRGAIISGDLGPIRSLLALGMVSPAAETFVRDGDIMCERLAEGIHLGADPGPEVESQTRGFMAFSRNNFSEAALGVAASRTGMSNDEAVAALKLGEWDPFADVQIP